MGCLHCDRMFSAEIIKDHMQFCITQRRERISMADPKLSEMEISEAASNLFTLNDLRADSVRSLKNSTPSLKLNSQISKGLHSTRSI